ncbi:MAG: tryptophan synthase subunit alpha [Saprospiraceae bacterium]|nr:tryptophan synthase subunit alpha [Saprospiraceae bacterium]
MSNKVFSAIQKKGQRVLNVYFTAGHPTLSSIPTIVEGLQEGGADLIELGMPYSDPLADGTTIQQSSAAALHNGMNLKYLFEQVKISTSNNDIPIILMGYYNQILQFGVERFLDLAAENGVSGMIIPDLPMFEYENLYQTMFEERNLGISFLISPMTSEDRIQQAGRLSSAFLYMVSQSSITGKTNEITQSQKDYFTRVDQMDIKSPRLIGFGIYDKTTFDTACQYSSGAIVGSSFIRALEQDASKKGIINFVKSIID